MSAVVVGNDIHHNDRMVTSSRGGNGIVFSKTTGRVTATGNRLWGNRARHLTDAGPSRSIRPPTWSSART